MEGMLLQMSEGFLPISSLYSYWKFSFCTFLLPEMLIRSQFWGSCQ